jgi:hypothetical protein
LFIDIFLQPTLGNLRGTRNPRQGESFQEQAIHKAKSLVIDSVVTRGVFYKLASQLSGSDSSACHCFERHFSRYWLNHSSGSAWFLSRQLKLKEIIMQKLDYPLANCTSLASMSKTTLIPATSSALTSCAAAELEGQ